MSVIVPAVKYGRLKQPFYIHGTQFFIAEEITRIAVACADAFGVGLHLLYARNREAQVALARQTAMYIAREAGASTVLIGGHFKRDHTTVMHAWTLIDRKVRSNKQWESLVADIFHRSRLERLAS